MRNKRFPYYKDWNTIFGKDRANAGGTETLGEAINDVMQRQKGKSPLFPTMDPNFQAHSPTRAPSNAANSPSAPMASDADSDFRSRCHGETVTSPQKTGKIPKKRSRMHDGIESDMVNLMGKFLGEISSHMGEIKTNLGTEREGMDMRKHVHAAIKPLDISAKDKLKVAGKICEKQKDVEMFLGLDDEGKLLLARMIISNEY